MIRHFAATLIVILAAGCSSLPSEKGLISNPFIRIPGPVLPENVSYEEGLSEFESLAATLLLLDADQELSAEAIQKGEKNRPRCVALTSVPGNASPTDWGKDVRFPSFDLIRHLNRGPGNNFISVATCFPLHGAYWHIPNGQHAHYVWVEEVRCKEREDNRPGVYCLDVGWYSEFLMAEGYSVRAERQGNRFRLTKLAGWLS
ncbi:hypothetical protein FHW79_006543 [Azospirillum sp. OGB3]|uniref:hypothetical protein n=1 Tax=Azospirillum sp. OGB3 TaxID=2587012 RepID=UPI00160580AC|nr:hypothetical protein [Azospirillum sp. OGB3]MBB3268866.1 hypothetical protein [Azospirillum sp. OGB3]